MADLLGLINAKVLEPKRDLLYKLVTYVPDSHVEVVRDGLFEAGAGTIGNYSECSFITSGTGTFLPGHGSNPFSGFLGERKY